MCCGNIVNIVDVSLAKNVALVHWEQEQEFAAAQGIDFVYEDASHTLRIRIQHSMVLAQHELVSMKLNSNAAMLIVADNVDRIAPVINEVNNEGRWWCNQLVPGTLLLRYGELMEFTRVEHEDVVLISDTTPIETTISMIEAEHLVEEYLGW